MNESENRPSNPRIADGAETILQLIGTRLSRRGFLVGVGATAIAGQGCASTTQSAAGDAASLAPSAFGFDEIARGADGNIHVPDGYTADLVIRWGDAVFPDAPTFDPAAQSAAAQERQFGYNNDFVGFYPLPDDASGAARGLLCVNHEYTSTQLMFPGLTEGRQPSKKETEIELAAHGGTIFEIMQDDDGAWRPVLGSPYNRRVTGGSTPMTISSRSIVFS